MEQYLEFAKKLAKEAEAIALKYFSFEVETTWKGDNTPLTKADTEINDPVMKNMYWAYRDGGAYRNGKKITVSKDATFENTTYSLTGGSGKDVGFSNLPFHKLMGEKKSRVMKFPSFVYGAIRVANGKYAGAFL